MDCRHCSSTVEADDKFCRTCGRLVRVEEPSTKRELVLQGAKDVAVEGKIIAREALELTKRGLQTETGKSVATCAAIGAAAGSVVPFVGSIAGAGVGAFLGLLRK